MWFKLFIVLRLPVSVLCMMGLAIGIALRSMNVDFGLVCAFAALVFLVVVSVKLARRRPGALHLAGWLLAVESLGAGLFLLSAHGLSATMQPFGDVVVVGLVALWWVLPNILLFYKARALFREPAKEKLGL
jgi:hypothetical protein